MKEVTRRNMLGAAWSLPVIALAVSTPAAAASEVVFCTFGGGENDNGVAKVVQQGKQWMLIIAYKVAPDIYEVNAKFGGHPADMSFGTNYGTAPTKGTTTWVIPLPAPALSGTQIHSFNSHAEACKASS